MVERFVGWLDAPWARVESDQTGDPWPDCVCNDARYELGHMESCPRFGQSPDRLTVLVCGSRSWLGVTRIESRLRELPRGTRIIHGGARGADDIADTIALELGFDVGVFVADWRRHGRSAGVRRSLAMLDDERPDLVLAFWDGRSKGTAHTINAARERGIPVEVVR
jgi:hypothetical protein